jgi:hypothetical protein
MCRPKDAECGMLWRQYMFWQVNDRLWTDADTKGYASSGCDGVKYRARRPVARKASLDFLRDVHGLRAADLEGRFPDDTPAFDVPTLETLMLHTKCAAPLDLTHLPDLLEFGVDHRPNLEAIRGLASLAGLEVWEWEGGDLGFLGAKPALKSLRLEGTKNSAGSLAGIEDCPALEELTVLDTRLEGIEPLRALPALRRLQITQRRPSDGAPWDLSALTTAGDLTWLTLTFCGPVESVRPLLQLPALRDVRLRGTTIVDGDIQPLIDLPGEVVVGPFDDHPHCTHTYAEVQRLRRR